MAEPVQPAAVKVGVLLAAYPEELGGWLADAAAFDSAGVDALWLAAGPDGDPLALAAALAAMTYRALLVTPLPAANRAADDLARTLRTLGRLSRGRLRLIGESGHDEPRLFRRIPADVEAFEYVDRAADPAAARERWLVGPAPDGRAAWQAALLATTERDFQGLLVPAGPRLLDILRSPGDPGERLDLQLAQG